MVARPPAIPFAPACYSARRGSSIELGTWKCAGFRIPAWLDSGTGEAGRGADAGAARAAEGPGWAKLGPQRKVERGGPIAMRVARRPVRPPAVRNPRHAGAS